MGSGGGQPRGLSKSGMAGIPAIPDLDGTLFSGVGLCFAHYLYQRRHRKTVGLRQTAVGLRAPGPYFVLNRVA